MASAAASGNVGAATLTAIKKGEATNLIRVKVIVDPAGATGAASVSVSGSDITVKCKNTDGVAITNTKAEIFAALSGDASVSALVAVTAGSNTGADTGAAYTGAGGAFVPLAGGAEGTSTVLLDDLAAAGGDKFTGPTGASRLSVGKYTHYKQTTAVAQNGAAAQSVDIFEVFNPADGSFHSVAAVAATGATAAVLALGRTLDRQARKGVGSLGKPGV